LAVEVKVIKHLFLSLIESGMSSVAFLPKELSGSDEGSWMLELPPDDIGPLVELDG
jgi:hypothetical protein